MNNRLKEIVKFVFTGGVCFLIEYAALIALKEWLHLPVVAATPIAFLISVVFNYLLCVKWVFDGAAEGNRKAQIGFIITSLMGLALNWLIMWALTALFGEDAVLLTLFGVELKVYMLNKVVATGLVMVWNYFTKRWLLKGNEQ
ncbi:MAG: GtrA family protein [Clostridia bacterium]|nr:GtrA family protein [Clostridia bacterium]